jgi:hypothetical protein
VPYLALETAVYNILNCLSAVIKELGSVFGRSLDKLISTI